MKTCLVVDDSKVIRKVARHILETLDFEVREAGDGREALDSCLQTPPDVILLDWNMPVMSGMDFLRALKDSGLPSVRRWCSAPPRTAWPISAPRSRRVRTNMS
jgi:two-component system chemotaxis response regulator CheY